MSQVDDCSFCAIADGTGPSSEVYRDDELVAFMTDRPVNPGHVLLIPRAHTVVLADLPPNTGAVLFNQAVRIQAALRHSGLRCEGINLFLADGEAAAQLVPHVHLHIIPRFAGDSFRLNSRGGATTAESVSPREELDAAAGAIRSGYLRL